MNWILEQSVFPDDEECGLMGVLRSATLSFEVYSGADLRRSLPDVDGETVLRGSCWLFEQLQRMSGWRADLWGTESDFGYRHYSSRYRPFLLNMPCSVVSLHEFCWKRHQFLPDSTSAVFVRPDSALKCIDGQVVTGASFDKWQETCRILQLPGDTQLIISAAKTLLAEHRCVIVDGQLIAASQYRPTFQRGCPEPVQAFVRSVVEAVQPLCRIYVLDIAETSQGLFVIEVGCFCCVALYKCDLTAVVERIRVVIQS